jgi:hypothetical protein
VYQIRYFVPFALMAAIFAVPIIVQTVPGMRRWETLLLSALMVAPIVNVGVLLMQRNPSVEWQRWTGVNLSSGGNDVVSVQARDFASAVKTAGRDIVLYSMPMNVTDAEFQAVLDYSRVANPRMPVVSIRRPVDWQRPTAYRVSDMLVADYWLFEPVRDRRVAEAALATPFIDEFHQEKAVFQAWATQLTASEGVETVSDTPTARVLRIADRERLESAFESFLEGRHWRTAFSSANPRRRWSETDLADALAQTPPALQNIHFSDRIELRALSVSRTANETTVRLWWKPMRSLKERDWIFFIHSIDDQGKIVLNHQIALDINEQPMRDETIRFNMITFASPAREASARLAVGFYRPDQTKLVADAGTRDWNGNRVIVAVP